MTTKDKSPMLDYNTNKMILLDHLYKILYWASKSYGVHNISSINPLFFGLK